MLFSPDNAGAQGLQLTRLRKWFTAAEFLKMATSDNAELPALCGARNPYPRPLGVVKPGAFADLLLVDGHPLADLTPVADPHTLFTVIIKDGVIDKDTRK